MTNWTWWQRNSPYWTERWDLAICRFRGNKDTTDWEATKLEILSFSGDELDRWQRNSPYWTERWDLIICRFRGNMDITNWEATKLRILPFRGNWLDMMAIWVIPLKNVIWYAVGNLTVPWRSFGRNCQRYYINLATKESTGDWKRLRGESIKDSLGS